VTIPFAHEGALLAQVLAIMRRTYGRAVMFKPVIKLGELEIHILNRTELASTSELRLTSLE
jgi:hypothetical protein